MGNKRRRYAVEPGMGRKQQPESDHDSSADEATATDFIAAAHDCIKQMTNKKYRNDKTKTRRLKEVENAATPTSTPKQSPSKNNNANSDSDSKSTSSGTESSKETAPKPEAHEQVRYQNWGNTQNYGQHQSYSKQLQATPYAQSWNNSGYEQS